MPVGIETEDFSDNIYTDWATSMTLTTTTTAIDNITGDETLTSSTTATISAVFLRKEQRWNFDKEGLLQEGDAYIMTLPSQTLNKDDVITANNANYRVQDIITRYNGLPNNEVLFKYANLFLI
jgi:hypothetical protein